MTYKNKNESSPEKNDRCLESGSKVEGSMGITFTGSTLAKVADDSTLGAITLESIRCVRARVRVSELGLECLT